MDNDKIIQEKKEYTDKFLTKQGKAILLQLYMAPGICSSDLAKRLDVRKNSMSNALDRLKSSQYEMVRFEARGRNKHYFLTEWGKMYTENYLCQASAIDRLQDKQQNGGQDICSLNIEELRKEAEECINSLSMLDSGWEFQFFEFIHSKRVCKEEEMCALMSELLQIVYCMYQLKGDNTFQDLMNKMSKSVKDRLKKWIEQQVELEPLWSWVDDSWQNAYQFIDRIFEGNNMSQPYSYQEYADVDGLSKEQLERIIVRLNCLVGEARVNNLNKMGFYQMMIDKYSQCNLQLVFYIAEKYKVLVKNMA